MQKQIISDKKNKIVKIAGTFSNVFAENVNKRIYKIIKTKPVELALSFPKENGFNVANHPFAYLINKQNGDV